MLLVTNARRNSYTYPKSVPPYGFLGELNGRISTHHRRDPIDFLHSRYFTICSALDLNNKSDIPTQAPEEVV